MKNRVGLVAVVIVGLAAILGCGQFAKKVSEELPKVRSKESDTFTLEGKEWASFELENSDIKVELPGKPSDKTPSASQFPPGYKEIFSSVSVHSFDEMEFGSSYSQLVPTGKRKFTIKELADTSMTALKKQARDLTYTLDIKSDSNAKYNGTFTRNGKSFDLKGCCIYQKSPQRVWAVITLYPKNHADGRAASERIIKSAQFKDSSETCN